MKGRSSHSKTTRPTDQPLEASENDDLVLDPSQVMRAMMAARKGKSRASSEESESEDSGSEDSGSEDSGSEDSVSESFVLDEKQSSGESSTSAQKRSLKRSRSPSETDQVRVSETTSRVKLASKPAPSQPKNPFDTPKAPSHSTFASLGLSQPLITALGGINIKKPTEIQSACVGPILEG